MNETMLSDMNVPLSDQLDLYALKMQATEGNCLGERPPKMRIKERAKYDAWYKISEEGLTTEEVKKEFVDKVKSLNLDSQFDEEFI